VGPREGGGGEKDFKPLISYREGYHRGGKRRTLGKRSKMLHANPGEEGKISIFKPKKRDPQLDIQ